MLPRPMKMYIIAICCFFCILMTFDTAVVYGSDKNMTAGWKLIWSDEFDGPNGSPPNPAKWIYDIGGGGWGNEELQFYTERRANSFQENGNLVIRACKEDMGGRNYTSARLVTRTKFVQAYGRFEARIKLPEGVGIWPAFWLLGEKFNPDKQNWPECGEIDIMENVGHEPFVVHSAIHGPGYGDESPFTCKYKLAGKQQFSSDYHIFAVEWQPNQIRFFVDGNNYYTVEKRGIEESGKWVFDKPCYVILNVAVGGDWPGIPDDKTVFPQNMYVDYVRIYGK
jgi:beta-glucanase (GH16 family)